MSALTIALTWQRHTPDFNYKTYDRTHTIKFSGGTQLQATAAPEYLGNPELTNPEELLIAALSSCHMLSFLAIAAYQGFTVDNYHDAAIGTLAKNDRSKMAITQIVLKPQVQFSGAKIPDVDTLNKLHDKAHDSCFIANSLNVNVIIEKAI